MATQPNRWTIEPATSAQTDAIPNSAGSDDIDLQKLFPSAYELPLDAGGKAVPRRAMNAILKAVMQSIFFLQQGGVFSYEPNFDYTVGTLVRYAGQFYRCIQDNGASSTIAAPSNATYWERLIGASEMTAAVESATPAGCISAYAGQSAPSGWLICNGAAVSRTAYAALFSAIGTLYGTGNGSTTFNLPNFSNRFLRGVGSADVGTLYPATLPAMTAASAGAHTHTRGTMEITGYFGGNVDDGNQWSGAFYRRSSDGRGANGDTDSRSGFIGFQASRSWTGATSSAGAHTHAVTASGVTTGNTVLPLSAGVLWIIKA